jgi:hypothetical protein
MTDPNVIALLELLAHRTFWNESTPARTEAIRLVNVLRGGAKKPAEAAPVVPVKFDADGHAGHWERGWDAQQTEDVVELAFRLHPGEDAGETVAKMLAAVGRTA